jgi:hypothetical protein
LKSGLARFVGIALFRHSDDQSSAIPLQGKGLWPAGYIYVWQEAMFRNAKIGTGLFEHFEPPIIVRTRDKVYGVKIAGPSEIVYTPPDRLKTESDPLKNGVRVFIKTDAPITSYMGILARPLAGAIQIRIDKSAISRNRDAYEAALLDGKTTWHEDPPIWIYKAGEWLPARGVHIRAPATLIYRPKDDHKLLIKTSDAKRVPWGVSGPNSMSKRTGSTPS